MVGPDGRQLKSISLRDPARINLALEIAAQAEVSHEARAILNLISETVVPLLADLRTIFVEILVPMTNTLIEQGNLHTQLLANRNKNLEAQTASKVLMR